MKRRILVAGVGNIFLGDDGFGTEVARRLLRDPPPGAEVVDFGIRGLHLAYALLDGCDLLVAIDAMPRGGTPGTLYVVEPEPSDLVPEAPPDAHGMNLPAVFATVARLGGRLPRLRIVGCEPASVEEAMGLSPSVESAVGKAVQLVRDLVAGELPFEAEVRPGAPDSPRPG